MNQSEIDVLNSETIFIIRNFFSSEDIKLISSQLASRDGFGKGSILKKEVTDEIWKRIKLLMRNGLANSSSSSCLEKVANICDSQFPVFASLHVSDTFDVGGSTNVHTDLGYELIRRAHSSYQVWFPLNTSHGIDIFEKQFNEVIYEKAAGHFLLNVEIEVEDRLFRRGRKLLLKDPYVRENDGIISEFPPDTLQNTEFHCNLGDVLFFPADLLHRTRPFMNCQVGTREAVGMRLFENNLTRTDRHATLEFMQTQMTDTVDVIPIEILQKIFPNLLDWPNPKFYYYAWALKLLCPVKLGEMGKAGHRIMSTQLQIAQGRCSLFRDKSPSYQLAFVCGSCSDVDATSDYLLGRSVEEKRLYICATCAYSCHSGHKIYYRVLSSFRCGCSLQESPDHQCKRITRSLLSSND